MKAALTFVFSLLAFAIYSQDTTYYDNEWNKARDLKSCHYYEIIERDNNNLDQVLERIYYKSGQIRFERNYMPYSEKLLHGKRKEWYENGQIHKDLDYYNGKLNGKILTYWKNGQLKRDDLYEDDVLIEGKVFDIDGKESRHTDFQILPEFPGGMNSLVQYLGANLTYPKKSRRKDIEGQVLVRFIVEKDGRVSSIKVLESVSKDIDAEAIKVVRKMPKWQPGMEEGEIVRVTYNLPILFRLE